MLAALVITLREGLEAALIVGAVLAVLRRLNRSDQYRAVWLGVGVAIVISVIVGAAFHAVGVALEGRAEALFEGLAMLLAALVLSWMVLWMQRQGRRTQRELEAKTRQASQSNSGRMLFGLAFVAVVREGIETMLFLTAAAFGSTLRQTLLGGALGLLIAVAVGVAVFALGKRLDIRAFFRATSVVLILFAAGLAARGVHELQEAGLPLIFTAQAWDISSLLSETSLIGGLLKSLFGYNSNPSLLEVIVYLAYFPALWLLSRRLSLHLDEVQT